MKKSSDAVTDVTSVPTPHAPCVVLTGFDRSGTSAIATALASHPNVELFMQPFNSGPVRRKMNTLWTDATATQEDVRFFEGLSRGRLLRDYISSPWFDRSTVQDFVPGRVHVVKTTLNHMVVPWCMERFPELPQWAVWRDPEEILASLIRNDFIDQWYADATHEIAAAVTGDEELSGQFERYLGRIGGHRHAEAAFLIAVRSYVLFRAIPAEQVLSYRQFCEDPTRECGRFFASFGCPPHEITADRDANIIGKPFEPRARHTDLIDAEVKPLMEELFAPLRQFAR